MFFKGIKRHVYDKRAQITFVYQTKEARDKAASLLYRDTWFYVRPSHHAFNSCEFSFWIYDSIERKTLEMVAQKTGAIGIEIQEC